MTGGPITVAHVEATERRTMQVQCPPGAGHQEAYPEARNWWSGLDNRNLDQLPCTRPVQRPRPAGVATAGVPLHPQARELVEYGGNRVHVLSRSCLKQRVPNEPALRREVQALARREMPPEPPLTGGSTPRTPGANFTASIPSIPNMTDY